MENKDPHGTSILVEDRLVTVVVLERVIDVLTYLLTYLLSVNPFLNHGDNSAGSCTQFMKNDVPKRWLLTPSERPLLNYVN